jgi:hypothetical protein
VKSEFQSSRLLLANELLEASGILEVSEANFLKWKEGAIGEVQTSIADAKKTITASVTEADANLKASVTEADANLKASAIEAGKDFELAKLKASKISVDIAEAQFQAAAKMLKRKATIWAILTAAFFLGLGSL